MKQKLTVITNKSYFNNKSTRNKKKISKSKKRLQIREGI